jgi:hypothetical protein
MEYNYYSYEKLEAKILVPNSLGKKRKRRILLRQGSAAVNRVI